MGTTIGTLHVRRSIFIQASASRVWEEFETTDKIKNWLNLGHAVHEFEPKIGGQVRMSIKVEDEDRYYGGTVLVCDVGREITFNSQWDSPHSWVVPTIWTIRMTPLYDGTQVEIFHHGFERLGADAADNLQGYEEGWDVRHLKALRAIIDG